MCFLFRAEQPIIKSAGCNYLFKNNKSILLTDAQDLVEMPGWTEKQPIAKTQQKELFIHLCREEKSLLTS
jgi:DNA processing protein